MSETEARKIIEKAEILIKELGEAKVWYKRMIITCVIFLISIIAGGGVVLYKQSKMEEAISQAVPRSTIMMLDKVYTAQTRAMITLAEDKYQESLNRFEVDCATIRSQIILWNSEINTRSGDK